MLIKMEVSPSNIADLMAISKSAVSQNRLRMQQKVFDGEGTAKDWDKFVLSL
jgi:predicted transcriptional regulator